MSQPGGAKSNRHLGPALVDIATGHWVRYAPWEPDWKLGHAVRQAQLLSTGALGVEFLHVEVAAQEELLAGFQSALRADLRRHLNRRNIPEERVVSARFELETRANPGRTSSVIARGQIALTDDRGHTYMSTRNVLVRERRTLTQHIAHWFRTWRRR